MNPPENPAAPAAPASVKIAEVRFSLPDLLAEIKTERAASTFAMERLDQTEIGKLFKSKAARGKPKNH
jgi:hypothetical protein